MTLAALLLLLAAPDPFELDPVTDSALMISGLGFLLSSQVVISGGELETPGAVGGASLNALDRHFAQRDNASKATYADLSNYAVLPLTGLLIGADLLSRPLQGQGEALWTDATLYAEALILNAALNNLVKIAVRRPRPYTHQPGFHSEGVDDALSFYSGHTSSVAALGATASYLAFTRHGWARGRWTLGGGVLMTAVMGWMRVGARKHFPSDVITGALMGGAVGLLVPHLHRRQAQITHVQDVEGRPIGLSLGGRF
ncbi:phosphatase PAP2 family protein [Myxococcota bacterium]|nr:phosphatase PAP2 family protein [Myxococcota bacterium]MBU1430669.1 phosphatase PAP2 family protein [Myxococcota bacterium]MBU1896402.1 phosphatase PAP2 family protein [Myxococcota bacterium]